MPVEIVMPKLGLTMTEGLIVEWKHKAGDPVTKGEVLFVLETEKVTCEVEAPADGVLAEILVSENETAAVGAVIGYLVASAEELEGFEIPGEAETPGQTRPETDEIETPRDQGASRPSDGSEPPDAGERVRASPLAKKVARALDVSLQAVEGTGPGGWVVKEDVEKFHEARRGEAAVETEPAGRREEDRLAPFTGMRRAIARQMMASKVETAQTYMSLDVDASKMIECREALLPEIESRHGARVSITDLMMKITAAAITRHPVMNTRWTEKGILYLRDVHMGMAMALDEGLIVPVIRDINKKSFARVAKDRIALIRKGREKTFLPDDIKGSTFTLSSMGMFGIERFTSNINVPETAILAVGAIVDKPVVVDGEIVVRPMMNATLSYDHRVIDGAEAGKFMRTLKAFIENPIIMYA
ncbi:MAG: 2-oxo acid dehydrogenase subunit E2 [Desulfobacterales bacterium]|nr:2-oxo acid dehydrogenase subunit E2 [Desulfobacterales bacterium]